VVQPIQGVYQGLRGRFIDESIAREEAARQAMPGLREARLNADQQRLLERQPADRTRAIAEFLNKQGGVQVRRETEGLEVPQYQARNVEALQGLMGALGMDAAQAAAVNVGDAAQLQALQQKIEGNKDLVAQAYAQRLGPGFRERSAGALADFNKLLSANNWQGDLARGGVVTGIAAGSTMGLTAAGQGLAALTAFIQQQISTEQGAQTSELNQA
jgi:hypothetical protein